MAGKLKGVMASVLHLYGVARSALPEGQEGLDALRATANIPAEAAPRIDNDRHRAAVLCHTFVRTANPQAWEDWHSQVTAPDSQFDNVMGAADAVVRQGDFEDVMRQDPARIRTMMRAVQTPSFGHPNRSHSLV